VRAASAAITRINSTPRLAATYAALFWVICLSVVYLPEWLDQIGLDTARIGLVLAAAAWLKVPVTLIAGNVADQIGRRKYVLLVVAGVVVCVLPLLLFVREFFWICLVWAWAGALVSTCVPLTDSIGVTAVRSEGAQYGRMRMWGSISFLIASISCGWVISYRDVDSTAVWLLLAGAVVLVVCVLRLPDYKTRSPAGRGLTLLPVLKLPGFLVFLLVAATLMASHAALYSLSTVYWSSQGITLSTIGLLWAAGVVAEIGIFFIAAHVQTAFAPWSLLIVAGLTGVLRWSLMAVVTDVKLLFVIQLLHAITFTFTQLAVVGYIANRVPAELTSSAQTIYDSCAIGIVFGAALYVSGLLARTDMALSFWAMAGMSALATLIAVAVVLRQRRREFAQ